MPPRVNRKYTKNKGDPLTIDPFGRGFVMAVLNINSLLAHLDDLKFFVLDSKIDVLAINETKKIARRLGSDTSKLETK